MSSTGSPRWDGMPHAHNPQAGEERILNGIEEIDILKERYRQAVEYMEWFQPAWDQLSEDERYVLDAIYGRKTSMARMRSTASVTISVLSAPLLITKRTGR